MSRTAAPDPQRALLQRLHRAMLAAADPMNVVPPALPQPPKGRTVVVALGKAAAAMALAVEAHWPVDAPLTGVAVVPQGSMLPLARLRCLEASHPVPDERSTRAASALLEAVKGLTPDDLVLALISGGGSALGALPAAGVSLEEKQAITRQLLRSGAPISAMNVVRKHLSAIKGGRLALAAAPAPVVTLVISDIPGDDPALVASGPSVPDESTCADALALLDRYEVQISAGLRQQLMQGALESAKPRQLPHAAAPVIVASAAQGLRAAQAEARQAGWQAHILSDAIEGEARDIAAMHAAIARHIARAGQPFAPPCILLSGGEATVTVRGQGKGGRNTEFALALLQALQGEPGIWGGSVGTDGLDGSSGGAGAWIAPSTWQAAQRQGLSAQDHLDRSDSGSFFERLGLLEHTGPTHTNINDFRALLIEGTP